MSTQSDPNFLEVIARASADRVLSMTQAMVRIDSQTPPSDTQAMVDLIAGWLDEIPGVTFTRYVSEHPIENIVARLDGGLPGKRLILNGHLDTYPIGNAEDWTQDPLGGEIIDGKLYARGSADMKGADAALIECLRIFAEHMRPFPGEIVLVLGGDEERMGELGAQWLIDHVPEVRGDGVIVADVGGLCAARLGEKGMLWLTLEASGRQAHGAHVHAGENAADKLIDALIDLRQLETLTPTPASEALSITEAAAGFEGADGPTARQTMQRVTVNLGSIEGGISSNLVPSSATAGLDIRIPLGLSAAAVQTAATDLLLKHTSITWTTDRLYEPTWTDARSKVALACRNAAEDVMGAPAWFDMRIGGSDARLWRRAGFETVVLGLTPYNLGAPDEYLRIDELGPLTAIYCLAAQQFLYG
jgi:succinyl-diaminopimelate desuccinylase